MNVFSPNYLKRSGRRSGSSLPEKPTALMKRFLQLAFLLLIAALPCMAQDDDVDGFVAREYSGSFHRNMPYRLFIPYDYDQSRKYPLVLWLHGAGGEGDDNLAQISDDQMLGTRVWTTDENQAKYPAFVLAPQSPTSWTADGVDGLSDEMKMVLGIIESLEMEFNIDTQRLYVTGQSNGGYGTWNLITRQPNMFAAAIPVCGGGNPRRASTIAKIPIWAFHGTKDTTVPVTESRNMIEAIKKAKGTPRYTEYPSVAHDVWKRVYTDPELPEWLFSQHR